MIAVYAPAAKHITIDLYQQQMGEKGLKAAVKELFVDPDER
jgi:hypothetical protein